MARQKSEDPIVPEGRRKSAPSAFVRGGKGVPVDQAVWQLELPLTTAGPCKGAAGGGVTPSLAVAEGERQRGTCPTRVPGDVHDDLEEVVAQVFGWRPQSSPAFGPSCALWDGLRS
jgi:hypothetical protein